MVVLVQPEPVVIFKSIPTVLIAIDFDALWQVSNPCSMVKDLYYFSTRVSIDAPWEVSMNDYQSYLLTVALTNLITLFIKQSNCSIYPN